MIEYENYIITNFNGDAREFVESLKRKGNRSKINLQLQFVTDSFVTLALRVTMIKRSMMLKRIRSGFVHFAQYVRSYS